MFLLNFNLYFIQLFIFVLIVYNRLLPRFVTSKTLGQWEAFITPGTTTCRGSDHDQNWITLTGFLNHYLPNLPRKPAFDHGNSLKIPRLWPNITRNVEYTL